MIRSAESRLECVGIIGLTQGVESGRTRPDLDSSIYNLPTSLVGIMPDAEACARFEMPLDREGEKNAVLGSKKEEHDLSNLEGNNRLRSHGRLSEQDVPLISNRRIRRDSGVTRR